MQRLILRRSGDIAPYRKIAQEGCDFSRTHLTRVTLVVEEDEAADPLQIRLLGSDAVVTQADHFAYLIQHPRLGGILLEADINRSLASYRVQRLTTAKGQHYCDRHGTMAAV